MPTKSILGSYNDLRMDIQIKGKRNHTLIIRS